VISGTLNEPLVAGSRTFDFTAVYREWFGSVLAWLRAVGVPESDLEDVTQEVFLVVRRKLGGFDGRNLPGWLYKIATQTASDQRRRAFFRRLVKRAPASELDGLADQRPDPLVSCETAFARRELRHLLDKLKEPLRVTFWLFEIEGYRASEIAALVGVPESTVTMRIHYARKELYRLTAHQRKEHATRVGTTAFVSRKEGGHE
jgi:RNA polymerase sigma-70 factor (ECF subfamily)